MAFLHNPVPCPNPAFPLVGRKCLLLLMAILGLTLTGCLTAAMRQVKAHCLATQSRIAPVRINDPTLSAYLEVIGSQILKAARTLDQPTTKVLTRLINIYDRFDIFLEHDPNVNAFVVGDDFAVISSGALVACDKPEEIFAILCHEFGHLHCGHSVNERIRYQGTVTAGVLMLALAAAADAQAANSGIYNTNYGQQTSQSVNQMLKTYSPYRKRDEYEADEYGFRLFTSMGFRHRDFFRVFEILLQTSGDGDSKSHPATSLRYQRIMEIATKYPEQPKPRVVNRAEFVRMKLILKHKFLTQSSSGTLRTLTQALASVDSAENKMAIYACGNLTVSPEVALNQFLARLQALPDPPLPHPPVADGLSHHAPSK